MTEAPWDLIVAGPARRAIERLPDKIALAVLDYLVGPLLENPHRVGKPRRGDLAGLHSARVGAMTGPGADIATQHPMLGSSHWAAQNDSRERSRRPSGAAHTGR